MKISNSVFRFYQFLTYSGFKLTGPFVIMIYRMTANDLLKFGIMYAIFVMGYAQCKLQKFM